MAMMKTPRSRMGYSDLESHYDSLARARQAHFRRVSELLFNHLIAAGWTPPDGYTPDDLRKEYTRTNYEAWRTDPGRYQLPRP